MTVAPYPRGTSQDLSGCCGCEPHIDWAFSLRPHTVWLLWAAAELPVSLLLLHFGALTKKVGVT